MVATWMTCGLAAIQGCSSNDPQSLPGADAGGSEGGGGGDTSTNPTDSATNDTGGGGDSSVDADAGTKSDAEAGSGDSGVGGANSFSDGTKTVNVDTINVTYNASGPSAGYLGYKADLSYSVGLGGMSGTGTFTCGAGGVLTHAQPGFVAYTSAYGASTCTINVTSFPTNSGDHLIGTYSGTIFKADGVTSITLSNGKFDGIRP